MDDSDAAAKRKRQRQKQRQLERDNAKSKATAPPANPTHVEPTALEDHVSPPQEANTVKSGDELSNNPAPPNNDSSETVNNIPAVPDSVATAGAPFLEVDSISTGLSPSPTFVPISAASDIQISASNSSSPSLGLILGIAIPAGLLFLFFTAFLAFSYRRNKKQLIARQRRAQAPILSVSLPKDELDAFFTCPDSVLIKA
jgi:hypothetical protein